MRLASRPPAAAMRRARIRCADRDRRGEQRARVDRSFQTDPRLDLSCQMRQRLLGFPRAARQPIERLGVEAFLAQADQETTQAGAREAGVGVGRVIDERRAARIGEGDQIALLEADERPGDRHAVARGHEVHAAQPRDAGSAQQTKEHGLGLIVRVMSGHERVGADRLRVIDEQAVARFARALLQAARWLRAFPLKNAMADPKPRAKRGDGLCLIGAFGSKPVIDRRRIDPRLAAPLRPFGRHQEQRRRIGAAGDGDQKRLGANKRGE